MIYCLTGKIIKKTLDSVVISCGGVGDFFHIPPPPRGAPPPPRRGGAGYTHMNVPQNDGSPSGFAPAGPRDRF